MRLTHLGHACLLVETGEARLLIDPGIFSHGFEELTGLDAVLISHQHADHVDAERLPLLLDANDGTQLIAEPEVAAELAHVGLAATPLHPGETVSVAGAAVSAAGGEHAVIHPDIPRVGNIGFVVAVDGEPTVFHPGDSYEAVPAGVDVLAVPLNAPWAALRETAEFARAVRPARVVPIHDGLLAAAGRAVYLRVLGGLLPDGATLLDLAGAGATELGAGGEDG